MITILLSAILFGAGNTTLPDTCLPAKLTSINGTCLGTASLQLEGADYARKIEWKRNGVIEKTIINEMPLAGKTVADKLSGPNAVFVDPRNNLYVTDAFRVQKWVPGAQAGELVAGGKLNEQFSSADPGLYGGWGLFVDVAERVYVVSSYDGPVLQIWANKQRVAQIDLYKVALGVSGGSMVRMSVNKQNQIFYTGLGKFLYRLDDASNGASTLIGGGITAGGAANQFNGALGVCIDTAGNIYVADSGNDRIQKWAPGANSGITVAGGNGPGAADNQLSGPVDVCIDRQNNLYIADSRNNRIQRWAPGATRGYTVAGGNGAGNADNQFSGPVSVTLDSSNHVYIADKGNNRIQKWLSGKNIATGYQPQGAGVYTATVTFSDSCMVTSNTVIINEQPAVPVISNIQPLVFCEGANVELRVMAVTGNQWYRNGVPIPGATAPGYVAAIAGNYTDTITLSGGCKAGSGAVTVQVNPIPAKPEITINRTGELVSNAGSGNQWYVDTTALISGAVSQTFIPKADGYYSVTATMNGCTSPFALRKYYAKSGALFNNGTNLIRISPNPAGDFIVITHNLSTDELFTAELVNLSGRKIIRKTALRNGSRISVAGISKGYYILKITSSNGLLDGSVQLLKL